MERNVLALFERRGYAFTSLDDGPWPTPRGRSPDRLTSVPGVRRGCTASASPAARTSASSPPPSPRPRSGSGTSTGRGASRPPTPAAPNPLTSLPANFQPPKEQPMYKLVLLRHGESPWNKENRFTGWTDVDLSREGRRRGAAGRASSSSEGATLRRRLHLGPQARDPHPLDRARRDGPDVASGRHATGG